MTVWGTGRRVGGGRMGEGKGQRRKGRFGMVGSRVMAHCAERAVRFGMVGRRALCAARCAERAVLEEDNQHSLLHHAHLMHTPVQEWR